jgi:hypothetical protein
MSRKPEQRLADRMREHVSAHVLVERIENWVSAGTPDTFCCSPRGKVTWIEHKIGEWPKRANVRVQWNHPLTIDQRNWHLTYRRYNGKSYILARVEGVLFLVPGMLADSFNDFNRAAISPFESNWKQLIKVLT